MSQEHLLTLKASQALSERARLELRVELMRRTLTGFATNATDCGACKMSNEIAREALARDIAIRDECKSSA